MAVLVTAVAGALGLHVALALLRRGETVLGVDLPGRGDLAARDARLAQLRGFASFFPTDSDADGRARTVLHLAAVDAPPGQRTAAELDFLERCAARRAGLDRLVRVLPGFSVPDDRFARAEEVVDRACARAYGLPLTVVRVDETYGPWGDPRGAIVRFADAILAGRPVRLADEVARRHLWLEDAAAGVLAAMDLPLARLDLTGPEPVAPERLLGLLQTALVGPEAGSEGASREPAAAGPDWAPRVGIEEGVQRFAAWYRGQRQVG